MSAAEKARVEKCREYARQRLTDGFVAEEFSLEEFEALMSRANELESWDALYALAATVKTKPSMGTVRS